MKKRIIPTLILLLFIHLTGYSQSFEKGDILIDGGIGLGIYGTEVRSSITVNNTTISSKEKDGTASVLIPIKAQYGISNRFSIGILFQAENYIIDEDSAAIKKEDAQGTAIRLIGTYYIINNDKFNLHAELGLGSATFNQEEVRNGVKSEAEWRGGNFSFGLGIKYYVSNHIGFFINSVYSSYSFDLDKININGTKLDVKGWEANFSGAETTVGLAIKF